jgi:demethoxyubiquinone hydroxylase (CLK1/Coq7/Cat5 family)
MTTHITDLLSSLQRGEIAATETYNQALEKFAGQPEETEVRQMRDEHREAANTLRLHIHEHGGKPSQGSGWWGAWAKCVEGTAKVFGKIAALKALKEGEEHGVKEYEEALKGQIAEDCKSIIRNHLLPQTRSHIRALDHLITSESSR